MSVVKEGLLYSKSHEWVETLPDGTVKIGISDYAQDSLGDIVFVDMHPAGEEVEAEGALADVESVKAVSEIYSPVAGTIKETNEELIDAPEKLNEDCYGNWICVMEDVYKRQGLIRTAVTTSNCAMFHRSFRKLRCRAPKRLRSWARLLI